MKLVCKLTCSYVWDYWVNLRLSCGLWHSCPPNITNQCACLRKFLSDDLLIIPFYQSTPIRTSSNITLAISHSVPETLLGFQIQHWEKVANHLAVWDSFVQIGWWLGKNIYLQADVLPQWWTIAVAPVAKRCQTLSHHLSMLRLRKSMGLKVMTNCR